MNLKEWYVQEDYGFISLLPPFVFREKWGYFINRDMKLLSDLHRQEVFFISEVKSTVEIVVK